MGQATDNSDEIRALLNTIPGQLEKHKIIENFSKED